MSTLFRLFLILAAFALAGSSPAASAASDKPNILFFILDDMGPADTGCFGSKTIKTPNIDRLASEGMRFTQAYAGCSVCAPTRSTLMTGKHMGRTSVRGNSGGIPLLDSDVTIAEVLAKVGYLNAGFGKWGLGDLDTEGVPEKQGFQRFFGYYHQVHAHQFYPEYLIDTGKKVSLPNKGFYAGKPHSEGPVSKRNPETGQPYVFSAYRIFEEMKGFLRENKGKTFFCYAPWTLPHGYLEIPEDDPAWQLYKDKPWPMHDRLHAAYCSLADRLIGETLTLLRELGLDDNTLIFFCSDNGAANTSPVLNSSGGLRGEKTQMYEGGIRTPLIVRWKGKIKPGTSSDAPVYLPDIMPTLAEIVGATPYVPKDIDGISITPELFGTGKLDRQRYLYWEWNGQHFAPYEPKFQAVRCGEWKLVRHDPKKPWELYNLSRDVAEKTNVAEQNPEIVKRLVAWIEKNREPHRPQIEPQKPKGLKWR